MSIFDAEKALAHYKTYMRTGSEQEFDHFWLCCQELVSVIAYSVQSDCADDLSQHAMLKLYDVFSNGGFDLERNSSLYSFISTTARNSMIDLLRKMNKDCKLDEDFDVAVEDVPNSRLVLDVAAIELYLRCRFPSLHIELIKDIFYYVVDATLEGVAGKGKGIISSLEVLYPLNRSQCYIIYHAFSVFLRHILVSADVCLEALCNSVQGNEYTLIPEVVLVLGPDTAGELALKFKGCYIKF